MTSEAEPNITAGSASLDFGAMLVGTSSQDSVVISNTGQALLNITTINTTDYQFSHNGETGFLGAGESDTIRVTYTANAAAQATGSLQIYSDDPDTPLLEIDLLGQGMPIPQAELSLSTTSLDFGSVSIDASVTQQLQLFNSGSMELSVSSLSSTSDAFTVQVDSFMVDPGGAYGLNIQFTPTAAETYDGSLNFQSSDANNNSVSISMSGSGYDGHYNPVEPTGVPYTIIVSEIDVDGHDLSAGDEIGIFEQNQTTLDYLCVGSYYYQGNETFPLQVVVWESVDSLGLAGFTIGSDIVFRLWGTSFDSTIEMTPQVVWAEGDGTFGSGEFSVVSFAAESNLDPVVAIDVNSLAFPATRVGSSSTQNIYVYNNGLTNLWVSSI
ncbi:MAG: choice-of-anchor D domain-containing protein, partial [Gammaproteobacteria bacterium]|nr:choice-of-anchor D domain-containing protein [Gammaproteobacteria bacterium]